MGLEMMMMMMMMMMMALLLGALLALVSVLRCHGTVTRRTLTLAREGRVTLTALYGF